MGEFFLGGFFMITKILEKEFNAEDFIKWDYLVSELARVFNLNENEISTLYTSQTAKIIAAIPFAASCKFPERYAICHLANYISEKKGFQEYASHCVEDDDNVFSRLAPIANFEGGDKDVIHHGMVMLALTMLEGYRNSMEKDKDDHVYNPLVSGSWNYETLKRSLLFELKKMESFILDELYADGNGW